MPETLRKLLDVVDEVSRVKHYSYRTEQTYVEWIKRFIHFHNKRHPREMGTAEVQAFITFLAVNRPEENGSKITAMWNPGIYL